MSTIPGVSDHDIVVADCEVNVRYSRKVPRKIHLYSKADWNKLREETRELIIYQMA